MRARKLAKEFSQSQQKISNQHWHTGTYPSSIMISIIVTATVTAIITTLLIRSTSISAMEGYDLNFPSPIAFTQYKDTCDGEVSYSGLINKISMIDGYSTPGSFCTTDTITDEDGSTTLGYSKLDIISCTTDKVYENWYNCSDDMCSDCNMEYQSYTTWDSYTQDNDEDVMGQCFTYYSSFDDSASNAVVEGRSSALMNGTATVTTVGMKFNDDTNNDDVVAYMNFVKDNSCVAFGKPMEEPNVSVSKNNTTTATTETIFTGTISSGSMGSTSKTPVEPVMNDPDVSSSHMTVSYYSTPTVATLVVVSLSTFIFL